MCLNRSKSWYVVSLVIRPNRFGTCAYANCDPTLWNKLPCGSFPLRSHIKPTISLVNKFKNYRTQIQAEKINFTEKSQTSGQNVIRCIQDAQSSNLNYCSTDLLNKTSNIFTQEMCTYIYIQTHIYMCT